MKTVKILAIVFSDTFSIHFHFLLVFLRLQLHIRYIISYVLRDPEALVNCSLISLVFNFNHFYLPIFKFTNFFFFYLHSPVRPIQWILKFQLFDLSLIEYGFLFS